MNFFILQSDAIFATSCCNLSNRLSSLVASFAFWGREKSHVQTNISFVLRKYSCADETFCRNISRCKNKSLFL